MKQYFLGVDVGGTKTEALVADDAGQALGVGLAGPGNHETVGYDGLKAALQESVKKALDAASLVVEQIMGAGFGIGGYDWPSELPATLGSIRILGLRCPVEVVNDTVIGLIAGAENGWGIAVVAGTGNNVRGRDRQGREGRITGNGTRFGEYGGASELAARVVQVVTYEWTRRGPATALTPALIDWTGAKSLSDLIEGLEVGIYDINAKAAPLIIQVANQGDPLAREIVAWSGRELGLSATGVIRQLGIENEEFDVVQVGSLHEAGPLFTEALRQAIQEVAPEARLVRLKAPPVIGGVLLGMEKAGLDGNPLRQRLATSTLAILAAVQR